MFAVDPAVADAIRHAFQEHGEFAAIVELRQHFPLFESNEQAETKSNSEKDEAQK